MSCCPQAPTIIKGGSPDLETGIADVPMLKGESTECFMATANNPTNMHDDATENVPNKIENPTIPMKANGTVDITFKMQKAASGIDPTRWEIKDDTGGTPTWLHPAASNDSSEPGYNNNDPVRVPDDNYSSGKELRLHGTFRKMDFGKKFRCTIAAFNGSTLIDNRGYIFSPDNSPPSSNLQLLHPLPGAICTSRYNPQRMHPVSKIIKPHFGADFAYNGGKIGDVLAAADGEVILVAYQATGAGNYAKIEHKNDAGKHLATTVYMHLEKVYVCKGQKVSAGQKIGREGNSGIGTGSHLHFECRLPNGTAIDPEPLIKGQLLMTEETNDDNSGKGKPIQRPGGEAVLTPANVDAKVAGCVPYGPDYPTPTVPDMVQPAPATPPASDPFELAWALTMGTEVVAWEGTPPARQTTLYGTIKGATPVETKLLRARVGFIDHPADPGGVTKFGIAQKFNKTTHVEDVVYADAHDVGYSKFWKSQLPAELVTGGKPRSAIAAFNIGFLCGVGGARSIVKDANISNKSDMDSIDPICDSMKAYLLEKIAQKPSKAAFRDGWMARVEKVRQYSKTVTL